MTSYARISAEASRLHADGFTVMGLRMGYNAATGKKRPYFKLAWQTAVHETCLDTFFGKDDDALAIITGDQSDLLVVDLDRPKPKDLQLGLSDAVEAIDSLIEQYGLHSSVPTADTASGGRHYFFSLSKSLADGLLSAHNSSKCAGLTLDTRADGGCVIVFPSTVPHPDGPLAYQWKVPPGHKQDLLPAPVWLIALLNDSGTVAKEPAAKRQRTLQVPAQINDAFTAVVQSHLQKLGCSQMGSVWLRAGGVDYKLQDPLCTCPICNGTHTSNAYRARMIVDRAFTLRNYSASCHSQVFGWEASRLISNLIHASQTDDPWCAILKAVYRLQGREMCYTKGKRFLSFTDHIWQEAHPQLIKQDVKALAYQVILPLVTNIPKSEANDPKVKALNAGLKFIQKAHNVSSILQTFETLSFDVNIEDQLDMNPDLLAVGNGVVDLTAATLRPGKTYDNLSLAICTDYRPDTPTPMIDSFFRDIFNGDQDVISYMQRLLGYGITGHTREQVWAIWTGVGSNGKGICQDILKELMGPFAVTMPSEVLFETGKTSAGASTPHLQTLIKKRLGFKDEGKSDKQNVLNEELIKTVTGSSKITSKALYKEFTEFQPTHLPILLCNKTPHINVEDTAMMRRLIIIPFSNVYTSADSKCNPFDATNPNHRHKDDTLRGKLLSQEGQEQLLVWLVKGAKEWYERGLGAMPGAVGAAYDRYVEDNDTLTAFLRECYEVEEGRNTHAPAFLQAYKEYSGRSIKQKELKEIMKKRGFSYATTGALYRGLGAKSTNL